MDLSIVTRIKITAVIFLGVLVLGLPGWSLLGPESPMQAFVFYGGNVGFAGYLIAIVIAFIVGFIACLFSAPYTRHIGITAVPFGMAVWSIWSGSLADLLRSNADAAARKAVYGALMQESALWLVMVAVGYLGVAVADALFFYADCKGGDSDKETDQRFTKKLIRSLKYEFVTEAEPALNTPVNNSDKTKKSAIPAKFRGILAIITSVVIAHLLLGLFARDVVLSAGKDVNVFGQPANLQIAFAVAVSFCGAAFVAKKLFDVRYVWPILGILPLAMLEAALAGKAESLEYLAGNWPVGFYLQGSHGILPIQFVSFGVLGCVWGYWWAVKYDYWRLQTS